jgi:signal transduction histidine kinase
VTISLRGRFLLAFLGISAFAVLAAAAAMWAFLELGRVVARITEERAPAALASLELSRQAERIAAAAPALLAARSEGARTRVAAHIRTQFASLETLRGHLRGTATDPDALRAIESAVAGLDRNLDALTGLVAERLAAARRKEELQRRLSTTLIGAQRLVDPGILVLKYQLAAARRGGSETGVGLSETVAQFAPLQNAKLEIAAVNNNLLRAAEAEGIADLPLLAFALRRSIEALEALTPGLEPQLQERFAEQVRDLKNLAEGPASLPAAREQELQALARGEQLLAENVTLSGGLTHAVDRLVAAAKADITAAGGEAAMVRQTSTAILLAAVLASLLSSAVIVWLYVDRNLVSRLRSMLAIAGGNLHAILPATGPDELGQMATSLGVFRDTAVEVEEQRLRERQVVLDTIDYGVLILDSDLRVRMYNRAFRDLWELPDEILRARQTLEELLLSHAGRGLHGVHEDDWDDYVARRLVEVRTASTPPQEWHRPDGRVLQYEIVVLPDGGRMLTYFELTRLKRAEEALVHAQKMAALGQLTAGIAHEIKNPLNFVNNFSALSSELTDELSDVLKRVALPGKVREEVEELTGTLKDNLGRVVQHGKRADSIVKNMLLHSREGSGEHRPVEINTIIDESLNLAYHGARAEGRDFNITLERDLDPGAGIADIYPQEITRVLLNLISNGFYAATKRAAANGGLEPKLKATTRNLGDKVEIRIRDNGIGIPSEIREKIFNPFFTTKPAGEGTGLGLSMSHDIVVKQHGGAIEVATEPGVFTEFIITLPRMMPAQAEAVGQGH